MEVVRKLIRRKVNILDDLPEKKGRNIPTAMKWNCCASTVRMTILLMRTSLADLNKTQMFQYAFNLTKLQNGQAAMGLNRNGLCAHELCFKMGIAVLQQHSDNLL